MTQDEAIIIKRKQEYYSSLADIDNKLKDISKGYKLGKKLGLTDDDLSPWSKLETELLCSQRKIRGLIANLQDNCEHEFEKVGEFETIFGKEIHFECKKCGFNYMESIEK